MERSMPTPEEQTPAQIKLALKITAAAVADGQISLLLLLNHLKREHDLASRHDPANYAKRLLLELAD
jgi:hypothetical protein